MRKTCARRRQIKQRRTRKIHQRGRGGIFTKPMAGNQDEQRRAFSISHSTPGRRNRREIILNAPIKEDLYDIRKAIQDEQQGKVKKVKVKKNVSFSSKTKKSGGTRKIQQRGRGPGLSKQVAVNQSNPRKAFDGDKEIRAAADAAAVASERSRRRQLVRSAERRKNSGKSRRSTRL
jgi:hypothetical protein